MLTPKEQRRPDAVLLDDDSLVHLSWRIVAEEKGIVLESFSKPIELLSKLSEYDPSTVFYLDSHLKDGLRGEDFVAKVHEHGFRNIYLATGDHPSRFGSLPMIKGIVGKEPPWLAGTTSV